MKLSGDGLNGSRWPLILVGLALTIFGATAGPLVDIGGDRARLQELTHRVERQDDRLERAEDTIVEFRTIAAERGIRLNTLEQSTASILSELRTLQDQISLLRQDLREGRSQDRSNDNR